MLFAGAPLKLAAFPAQLALDDRPPHMPYVSMRSPQVPKMRSQTRLCLP